MPSAPRILIRPQGSLLVDGGCNYFSGRIERDAQGCSAFRYGGTHGGCEKPPRLRGFPELGAGHGGQLPLGPWPERRSGANDLVRLQPSANQDSQDIEQVLASRAATSASPRCSALVAGCRGRIAARSRSRSPARPRAGMPRPPRPGWSASRWRAGPLTRARVRAQVQGDEDTGQGQGCDAEQGQGKGKAAGKAKPAANHGQHKTSAHGHHKR